MSIHWIDLVWKLSSQKGSALLLMLAIADSANDDGLSYPGYDHLAQKTRLSARHVVNLVEHVAGEQEIAVERRGAGAKDTNHYILLLGRAATETDRILAALRSGQGAKFALYGGNKGEKISPLPTAKPEKISSLRVKKYPNKGELASSPDPLTMDGSLVGWLEDDPISRFLRTLPGYNPKNLETDRAAIAAQDYDLEGLQALWDDAQTDAGENPIGLFLYRAGQGVIAPSYAAVIAERQQAQQRAADAQRVPAQRQPPAEQTAAAPAPIAIDPSLTQPLPGRQNFTPEMAWTAALGELQLEMTRATFETWVKPAVLLSVNGTWRIGVPNQYAKAWCETRLQSTIKRVLAGVVGEPVQPEFVVVAP